MGLSWCFSASWEFNGVSWDFHGVLVLMGI